MRFEIFKYVLTALFIAVSSVGVVAAQQSEVDTLYQELFDADETSHIDISNRIVARWERSGSAAMDLLLQRGIAALDGREFHIAVEHFTALIDHAPDFAEGYYHRATVYYAMGLMGPALDDLRQALVLNPRHFVAMQFVAQVMEELGQIDAAKETLEIVLQIYPLSPIANAELARLDLIANGQSL